MIRGLIFDCFGVLYHGSLGYLREITPPEYQQALGDLSRSSDLGYVSAEEYVQEVARLTGRSATEVTDILHAEHIRNQDMINLVLSYRGNYPIALLSNVGQGIISRLFTSEELSGGLFDAVVLSSEVHMAKPYPEIYEYAAAQLGVEPYECVMIDDLTENIDGAKQTGMEGIVSHTAAQTAHDLAALLERHDA